MNRAAFVHSRFNDSAPIRVLLADPDASLFPVYREPLSREGFELVTAVSGLECVARLREQIPDVFVLEPQLPWGGGDGVLAIMGECPDLAMVPVMILTSCHDPHILNRMARFPISDYQLKPLAPDRLAGRLRSLLDHPRLQFTLADQTARLECAIARRTAGRSRKLGVETIDGRVIARGRSDSQHIRRSAPAAVLEAFAASQSQSEKLELDIDVRGS